MCGKLGVANYRWVANRIQRLAYWLRHFWRLAHGRSRGNDFRGDVFRIEAGNSELEPPAVLPSSIQNEVLNNNLRHVSICERLGLMDFGIRLE